MKVVFAFEARFTANGNDHCGYIRVRDDSLTLECTVGRASTYPIDPLKIARPAVKAIDRVATAFNVAPSSISMIPVPISA